MRVAFALWVALVVLGLLAACGSAPRVRPASARKVPAPRVVYREARDKALRAELVSMAEEDQLALHQIERDIREGRHDPEDWASAVTDQNTERLRAIIEAHGWPGIDLVGFDGADAAWLIAQHADNDLAFQEKCLRLLRRAYKEGRAQGEELAYLTDRVLTAQGRRQLYGTQGGHGYSRAEAAIIDRRRRLLGMPSLKEYRRSW